MSSGENIEIGIGADSSGLIEALEKVAANLKSLENVLAGVSGSFESAGEAAESAMSGAEGAAESAAGAVEGLGDSIDGAAQSAEASKSSWETFDDVADQAGRADSALSGLAATLDHFGESGQRMAELGRQAADAAGGIEQMMLALRQAPLVAGAAIVAIGAFEVVIGDFLDLSEQMLEANQRTSDAYDRLSEQIVTAKQAQDSFNNAMDFSLGVIDEITAANRARLQTIEDIFEANTRVANRAREVAAAEEEALVLSIEMEGTRLNRVTRRIELHAQGLNVQEAELRLLEEQMEREGRIRRIREDGRAERRQAHSEAMDANREQFQANQALIEQEELIARAVEHRIDRLNQLSALTVISQARQEEAFSWWGTATQTMGTTIEVVDEASGAFFVLQDGLRATEEQFSLLQQQHVLSNQVFAQGSDAVQRQAALVEELNTLLGHEDERYRALTDHMVGMDVAHGALNMVTMQAIDVNELYGLVLEERNRVARESVEVTEDSTRATEDHLSVIERLNEMTFQAEQTLRDQVDAHAELYTRDTRMLEELSREYAGYADVQNAIEEARTAILDEFIHERNEMRQQESDEAFQSARQLEDMLRSLDSISEGRTFETFAYRKRLLEEHRDEQLFTLERMREDLKLHGANQATIDRVVAAERLAIQAEFDQAREDLADDFNDQMEDKAKTRLQTEVDLQNEVFSTSQTLAQATLNFAEEMEQQMFDISEKEARRLFRVRQAATAADIFLSSQQAAMRALADLGPIAGAISASAIAISAAASIGTVLAEEPPSFDIGGKVRGGILSETPDQMTANVLPGEAILNRSATERLGESGVNALNSGSGLGGVVVVPAYRHFDRFIQDEYRKGGSFRRIVDKERQFPVGQRRY